MFFENNPFPSSGGTIKRMTIELPMEIAVTIVRSGSADNVRYSARWEAARFLTAKNEDEVFRCSAAGKEFTSCVAAAKERVRAFANEYGIDPEAVAGLDDTTALIRTAADVDIRFVAVTYNDWLCTGRQTA